MVEPPWTPRTDGRLGREPGNRWEVPVSRGSGVESRVPDRNDVYEQHERRTLVSSREGNDPKTPSEILAKDTVICPRSSLGGRIVVNLVVQGKGCVRGRRESLFSGDGDEE